MEENRQDNLHTEEQENNKTVSRQTRHTWIGDADEIRPEQINRTVTIMTAVWPENDGRSTRLVEKQRKAYKGFITDEEVREAETQAEEGRKARAADRAAREELAQTKKKLADKRIKIKEAGSIAEASLQLTRIFEEAQKAADLYVENVRRRANRKESLTEQENSIKTDSGEVKP